MAGSENNQAKKSFWTDSIHDRESRFLVQNWLDGVRALREGRPPERSHGGFQSEGAVCSTLCGAPGAMRRFRDSRGFTGFYRFFTGFPAPNSGGDRDPGVLSR